MEAAGGAVGPGADAADPADPDSTDLDPGWGAVDPDAPVPADGKEEV